MGEYHLRRTVVFLDFPFQPASLTTHIERHKSVKKGPEERHADADTKVLNFPQRDAKVYRALLCFLCS